MIEVTEYTDPCCSWAWGSEPKLRRLRWEYGHQVSWRLVMGGLVHDATDVYAEMSDLDAGQRLARYWSRVTEHTGAPYPVRLAWPPLTSHRMGQAVRAAGFQGDDMAQAMLRRLREVIFVVGRPADTWERLLDVAMSVEGLDTVAFARDLQSPQAEAAYELDWSETRRPNAYVRELEGDWPGIGDVKQDRQHQRYAFPTLVVNGESELTRPGWIADDDYRSALAAGGVDLDDARELPSPAEAVERLGVVTPVDLELLCGSGEFPNGAMRFDWGAGEVALSTAAATAWESAGWLR